MHRTPTEPSSPAEQARTDPASEPSSPTEQARTDPATEQTPPRSRPRLGADRTAAPGIGCRRPRPQGLRQRRRCLRGDAADRGRSLHRGLRTLQGLLDPTHQFVLAVITRFQIGMGIGHELRLAMLTGDYLSQQ